MRSVKINKIAAIGLLMVLIVGFGLATKPAMFPLQDEVEQEMYIVGAYPKVGEAFEVVYRLRLRPEFEIKHSNYCVKFRSRPDESLEITDTDKLFFSGLSSNEWKEFRASMRITKSVPMVRIGVGIYRTEEKALYLQGFWGIDLYLLDPETGQYGTKEEYDKQLRQKAEWWYDPAGEFTGDPVHPDCAKKNREIIAKMQEIKSNLTDWEALYLHYDGIQALMGGMGTQETTDEERWRFLLEMGWLEKQRVGKEIKEKWLKEIIEKYKGKSLTKEQGFNPNFFRGDSDNVVDLIILLSWVS